MEDRGQTAIEYLFLLGASVVFVVIVALTTRDVIFPAGKHIIWENDGIVSAQASFRASITPIPSFDIPPIPSTGPYCILNAVPNLGNGPAFQSELTAQFFGINPQAAGAIIDCGSAGGPPQTIVNNFVYKRCNYPAAPIGAVHQYFARASANSIQCIEKIINDNSGTGTPSPSSNPSASPSSSPSVSINPSSSPSASPSVSTSPSPTPNVNLVNCNMENGIIQGTSPMNFVNIRANFDGLPDGSPVAMKCKATDDPTIVLVVSGFAQIACNYINNEVSSSYIATASYCQGGNCKVCQAIIISDASGEPVCNEEHSPIWDAGFCNLQEKNDFDLRADGTTDATLYSAAQNCNLPGNACMAKNSGCRVRANQVGENVCGVLEPQYSLPDNWLWDKYFFKVRAFNFQDGSRLIEHAMQGCGGYSLYGPGPQPGPVGVSGPQWIRIDPQGKWITRLYQVDSEPDTHTINGGTVQFTLSNIECDDDLGVVDRFFISTSNDPSIDPILKIPDWTAINRHKDPIPDPHSIQIGQSLPQFDLRSDNMDYNGFYTRIGYSAPYINFTIGKQTNPGVINCQIAQDRYINCGPANANGQSYVTIRAIDSLGRFVEDTFRIRVGPYFDLPFIDDNPNNIHLPIEGFEGYIYNLPNLNSPNLPITYAIVNQEGFYGGTCYIGDDPLQMGNQPSIICPNFDTPDDMRLTIRATDSAGNSFTDGMRIVAQKI